jgi:cytochrome c-type biogenesis protein CcmH/NrfF
MGLGMRYLASLFARIPGMEVSNTEQEEIRGNLTERMDCLGCLAGSLVGTLASLLLKPSIVLDWIPF